MVLLSGIGGIAAMASYATGGTLAVEFGFQNALWAVIVSSLLIFLTGLPIAYQVAKNNIDMDLLTRAAGFGYFGSTLTSLIYASFTFIYFALEGAIMAQCINDYFHIPFAISYLISGIVIIPLVLYGMTALSKFQAWSQPVWLGLIIVALVGVFIHDPHAIHSWTQFTGKSGTSAFSMPLFASACGILLSLLAQIGEQADYLRFMPDMKPNQRFSWWFALIMSGPGWVIIGAFQTLLGTFLASYVALHFGFQDATVPIAMFNYAFQTTFHNPELVLTIASILVLLSQLKINVTNAYSGSLSWSNLFSRILHSHPGRVVWLLFQVAVGILIMEMGIFDSLTTILGFYSNVAVAWIGAVVSDIVINKGILKVSPPQIEFKRAHLYNFNPVGFGSMIIASVVSIVVYFGAFGANLKSYSSFLSLAIALVLPPIIAVLTKGKYYIARTSSEELKEIVQTSPTKDEVSCTVCGHSYELHDIAYCPFHQGAICSLCCSLDSACHDACKNSTNVDVQDDLLRKTV